MMVDLPEPEGPMTATNSPSHLKGYSTQRLDLYLSQIVGFEYIFETNDRLAARPIFHRFDCDCGWLGHRRVL